MKVAMIVLGTAGYIRYASNLIVSARKHFFANLNGWEPSFYVMTDQELPPAISSFTTRMYLDHVPYPLVSLMRYRTVLRYAHLFSSHDYIFVLDSDMLMLSPVGPEVISDRTAVLHYKRMFSKIEGSKAFVDADLRRQMPYYLGSFYGGKTDVVLSDFDFIHNRLIFPDIQNLHFYWFAEEPYLSRYLLDHPPTRMLPYEFASHEKSKATIWSVFKPKDTKTKSEPRYIRKVLNPQA